MAKKRVRRAVTKINSNNTNKILIENFVALQKVMTNLAGKFDSLSDNITKLLQLFELSARSFAEKQPGTLEKDKEFLDKLNMLTEQNKTIAKGLTLLEEKLRQRVYGSAMESSRPAYGSTMEQSRPRLPKF